MAQSFTLTAARAQLVLARSALRAWTPRQYLIAGVTATAFALIVGIGTVLIPNSWFARDIETVWWNYPVWILTSIGAGLLTATYLRPSGQQQLDSADSPTERRTSRMGIAGGLLTWFAVGCPVCNKIALLALGYSGAITWFAPVQPVLAIVALILTGLALVWRLNGQVACPVPATRPSSRPQELEFKV